MRGGKWSGEVKAIGEATNFLSAGRFLVSYTHQTRKGRGFTSQTVTAWVEPQYLAKRVVSPRKHGRGTEGPNRHHVRPAAERFWKKVESA